MTSSTENRPEIPRPSCREFDIALPAYLEGQTSPEVERHARECEFCAVVLADLEAVRDNCRALPLEEPPALVWANVRAALKAQGVLQESRPACREFDLALPAYLEGEPSPEAERHARECEFCAVVLADLEAVRDNCRALPAEDPPALLWSKVRAALEAEGILKVPAAGFWGTRVPAWAQWAAPVGALAALAMVTGILVRAPEGLRHVEPTVPVRTSASANFGVSPDFEKTLGQLEQSFAVRESSLDPGLKATYRKSLDSLDASIKECRTTIEAKPSNALAQEYLLAAYTEKAEVLQSALEMDAR